MNQTEFNDWYRDHCSMFPIADWMAKQADPQKTLGQWFGALQDISFVLASRASGIMFRDESQQPRGFGYHPARVRKIANELYKPAKPQYIDGERVFRCSDCGDTGLLSVVHKADLDACAQGNPFPNGRGAAEDVVRRTCRSMGVACACDLGRRRNNLAPFDAARMLIYETQDYETLSGQVESMVPANYHSEFDEYNRSE